MIFVYCYFAVGQEQSYLNNRDACSIVVAKNGIIYLWTEYIRYNITDHASILEDHLRVLDSSNPDGSSGYAEEDYLDSDSSNDTDEPGERELYHQPYKQVSTLHLQGGAEK